MKTNDMVCIMAVGLIGTTFFAGCSEDDIGCPDGRVCDSSTLGGDVHGLRDNGTVDITVGQAWPNRRAEPPPLTSRELAEACSLLAACWTEGYADAEAARSERDTLLGLCLLPEVVMFWEERAVPATGINERWSFEVRAILAAAGDCDTVHAIQTHRPPQITCEEAGCWWSSATDPIPDVTCQGDIAILHSNGQTYERDCSHALQACDPLSPTGCTDRAPTKCTPPAQDRCEGDVRLGCDGNGRVSFHDCTRLEGGRCQDTDDGVRCVYPNAGQCEPSDSACEGEVLKVCVLGQMLEVDCLGLGLAGCDERSCVAKQPSN
ncbi:MAG: hypothetical protein ACOC1F_04695 [Myxococcota bacterium]